MRALNILGVVVIALWMGWITMRIEAVAQSSQDACMLAYVVFTKDLSPAAISHSLPPKGCPNILH